ncbi:quinoprotein dehydrogenase-associated SoxYZ-like carrier [Thiohalorhabdus methylotrophus]|uniref:Quinoprotein dehydrogenase-associated SoxYZ-like carrier n=1 Tax=Thiohalorhabdus methylotrophus TaxID=3242694 RepID=A0ABV4TUR5_9GAMM
MTPIPSRFRGFQKSVSGLVAVLALGLLAAPALAQEAPGQGEDEEEVWSFLRKELFQDRTITEGESVVDLTAPYRAQDPAMVPLSIQEKLPADSDRRIEKMWLIIDENPSPMTAKLHFESPRARANLSTRVRVATYSNVRVIAETADGELFMDKEFVKATGGCSAPVPGDLKEAKRHMGQMRMRIRERSEGWQAPWTLQVQIRHPNITGLQKDPITHLRPQPHYVRKVRVSYGGETMLWAETTFGLSENPSIRFDLVPGGPGDLRIVAEDTENNRFHKTLALQ